MSRCGVPEPRRTRPSPRTTTSYAVLGLLAVRDWSTYELAKQVQRSLNWFWPRAERKLYDEPKSLVADGLATASRSFTGQRPRTVYAITDEGRAALRRWLDEPAAPRSTEFEAMVKVFFADAGTLDQLAATLDATEAATAGRLRALAGMAGEALAGRRAFPERQHVSALALRAQYLEEAAVLVWARWAREQIVSWRSTTDAGAWDDRAVLAELVADVDRLVPPPGPDGTGGGRMGA
jgi:PadR family transcriptional regulator, regulatory protein AphA